MKIFLILVALNFFVFIAFGPIGIITSILTIYLSKYAVGRGKLLAKAFVFLDAVESGMSVTDANTKIRTLSEEQMMEMSMLAVQLSKIDFNGSQMALINKALSEGMEGESWFDRLWAKFSAKNRARNVALIDRSKDTLKAYKESFISFRNLTYKEFFRNVDASNFIMDDNDRILFMRYLIEANEAAMERFYLPRSFKTDLNVLMLAELGVPEPAARGMLEGLKTPQLRCPITGEILDEVKGAGGLAYREWLDGGDSIAVSRAYSLWQECRKHRKIRDELAPLGMF